jgi:purine-cytosine permease-like protein
MQLVFGAVLVGYNARFQGLTLGQLALAMGIAAATMTVYCIGSANVGAVVGQTHACTTRSIFGRSGSWLVSLLLVVDGMAFYLFTVVFIVSLGTALLGDIPALSVITALLAFVMILNNYFGFTGLLRFAQYVAVPVIFVWGCYATVRALTHVSSHQLAGCRTRPRRPPSSSPSARWSASRRGGTSPTSSATRNRGGARCGTSRRSRSATRWAPSCSRSSAT